MAHLYSHLRAHQIFGANTDVGKTIFTTGLCIASELLAASTASPSTKPSAPLREQTFYCKPVQTGPESDWDARHINRFSPRTRTTTLHSFPLPLSPHVSAPLAVGAGQASRIPSDAELAEGASAWLSATARDAGAGPAVAYVEAAGGVHSPSPAGTSLSTVLRPLRLPTILIGSSELGGISTTRAAYDSLLLAGFDVEAILLFPSKGQLGNVQYLRDLFEVDGSRAYGQKVPTRVFGIGGNADDHSEGRWGGPPSRGNASAAEEEARMRAFYQSLVHGRPSSRDPEETPGGLLAVIQHLRQRHAERIRELSTLAARTRESVWWPFTQHTLTKRDQDVMVIDSAHGDTFDTLLPEASANAGQSSQVSTPPTERLLRPTLDGSASWWTQCVGHANPRLTLAAARAAGRYGHVIFPNASHEPAVRLSERLIGRGDSQLTAPGRGWAERVYFSDDGSTGMEIALKMAIASARLRYGSSSDSLQAQEWEIIGLKGSYHGDTIGAMDACEPSVYSVAVDWYRGRGFWFDAPSVQYKDGVAAVRTPEDGGRHEYGSLQQIYDVSARLASGDPLVDAYRTNIRNKLEQLTREEGRRFGALVLEPIVMGAGGMIFVDPLYQRCLVDVVRESADLFSGRAGQHDASTKAAASGESDWTGLPVIFDEVFTGLYRLGHSTPAALLGVSPDISCLAKILTGGLLPMSVTLATSSIFSTFSRSENKVDALLHGHSYTAYPIGCEVANETVDILDEMARKGTWRSSQDAWKAPSESSAESSASQDAPLSPAIWSFWSPEAVDRLSRAERVDSVLALGCVLAVELRSAGGAGGYTSTASADVVTAMRELKDSAGAPFSNIHARPLGNVVYLMSSLNTPAEVLRAAEQRLLAAVADA